MSIRLMKMNCEKSNYAGSISSTELEVSNIVGTYQRYGILFSFNREDRKFFSVCIGGLHATKKVRA